MKRTVSTNKHNNHAGLPVFRRPFVFPKELIPIYIYPENLKAKPMLWLWELRDVAVIGVGLLLSVLALAQAGLLLPLVVTVLYAFLTIRVEDASILDFLRHAICFLFLKQQYYEWRERCD